MKQTLPFLCFLISLFAHGQEPSDSVFFHEMEDSVSAISFVRIKKPKALLDSIIVQVIRDSQQKPVRRRSTVRSLTPLPECLKQPFKEPNITLMNIPRFGTALLLVCHSFSTH